MNIHTGDPIHGHTARLNNCISFGYSRCVATCTRREKKPSPHMTYDRRRSCSAPEETTGLAGSCKTQQCCASSPLPCAPAPPSAARRLRRPLLHARVCVCVCVRARGGYVCVDRSHRGHARPSRRPFYTSWQRRRRCSARSGQRSAEQRLQMLRSREHARSVQRSA